MALYDLSIITDQKKAETYYDKLKCNGKRIELKEKKEKRSSPQNKYLHWMLTWFGCEIGYTIEEAKNLYKRVNEEICGYYKNKIKFYKSSADLSTKEMELCNERFRHWAIKNHDMYIPLPNEQGFNDWIREVNKSEKHNYQYLK